MKRPYSAGYSSTSRWAFDHHQAKKPTVWSEAIARPHLIVAVIGTLALAGMSGTAIWMALPDAPGSAQVKAADVPPIAIADAPAAAVTAKPVAGAPAVVPVHQAAAAPAPVAPAPVRPAAKTSRPTALPNTQSARLADTASTTGKTATEARAAPARSTITPEPGLPDVSNAYAETDTGDAQDVAPTAAIPNFGPLTTKTGQADEPSANDGSKSGRIARSVTMRSKPNVRGSAIANVPAKSQVDVISCSQWCEIIYKGKRGFIYKSFMGKVSG